MDDLDKIIKDALDSAFDSEEIFVDEDLINATMAGIAASEPDRETIRAEYDAQMNDNMEEMQETEQNPDELQGDAVDNVVSINAPAKKKNMAAIITTISVIAAVAIGAVVLGMSGTFTMNKSDSAATYDAAPMMSETTATVAEEKYYFDDEEDYFDFPAEPSSLFDNVYTISDPDKYNEIINILIEESVNGLAQMADEAVDTVEETELAGEVEEIAADSGATLEPYDDAPPTMSELMEALKESDERLKDNGGMPSEDAKEIIETDPDIEYDTIPYDYSEDKNPYWVEIGDASDEVFEESLPIITVYDNNSETGLDVCVMVYEDKALVVDYRNDMRSTYELEDGAHVADEIREKLADLFE